MSSRKIDDLDITMQQPALELIHQCRLIGIDLLVTCTFRSAAEQDILYAQGRTAPGIICTHATGGQSLHNTTKNGKPAALAFDVVPIINGRAYWTHTGKGAKIWQTIGEAGEKLGLEWGGRWKAPKTDRPHFQQKGQNAKTQL